MTRVKAGAVHKNEARLGIGRFILKKMIKLPSHKFFGSVYHILRLKVKMQKDWKKLLFGVTPHWFSYWTLDKVGSFEFNLNFWPFPMLCSKPAIWKMIHPIEGHWKATCQLKKNSRGWRLRWGSCWEEQKRTISSPMNGHWFASR